jgi:hypothetical protein
LFKAGPYWVSMTLRVDDGQLRLAQYRVSLLPTPEEPRPTPPLSDTRSIPLAEMERKIRQRYAEDLERLAVIDPEELARRREADPDITPEIVEAFARYRDLAAGYLGRPQRGRMGRPPLSDDELLRTARAYVTAERRGKDPIRAVMNEAGIEKSSAYRRVKQAKAHIEFLRNLEQED